MNFSNELKATLQIVIANTYQMYFKTHSYHWNVEGMYFSQLHDFFGELYAEVFAAVDAAAEQMRTLDEYAPLSLSDIIKQSTVEEDTAKPKDCHAMLSNVLEANEEVMVSLNKLFEQASEEDVQGLADWAAGRIDTHAKHRWMIRSHLKG
jgi:starvation-inducible DNA-binding protein